MSSADIQAQRRKEVQDGEVRFQPVILVVKEGRRFECAECHAIATFVNIRLDEDGNLAGYMPSCHDCYCKEEEQDE